MIKAIYLLIIAFTISFTGQIFGQSAMGGCGGDYNIKKEERRKVSKDRKREEKRRYKNTRCP